MLISTDGLGGNVSLFVVVVVLMAERSSSVDMAKMLVSFCAFQRLYAWSVEDDASKMEYSRSVGSFERRLKKEDEVILLCFLMGVVGESGISSMGGGDGGNEMEVIGY